MIIVRLIKVVRCVVGSGFESRRRHGCLQMYSVFVAWGTLINRRAASPLVKLVEGEERWVTPYHPRMFSLKIGVELREIARRIIKFNKNAERE
ncbi:hypothetical protein TNCV_2763361 [Trichonephila clavipes]|nr:hypothetical protein TNCV_2763361 [Trichonephila clavipes]